MIDFWKSMTASHILAGARQVARRVTEGRRPKGDRGTKCRVKERTREETCTTCLRSLWTASLGDGSEWDLKRKSNRLMLIRETKHQLRREFLRSQRSIRRQQSFNWSEDLSRLDIVGFNSLRCLKQVLFVRRLPSSRKTHSQRRKR